MRASLKKAKRKSVGETDNYLESKSDDMDSPLVDYRILDNQKDKLSKKQLSYSPETPSFKNSSVHMSSKSNDDLQRDMDESDGTPKAYRTPSSVADSSKSRSEKMHNASAMTETSDGSSESSEDIVINVFSHGILTFELKKSIELVLHVEVAVIARCAYGVLIYMIKGKIREIAAQDKLEHLFCLLKSVLPVVKQIHIEQCSELEIERKL